MHGAAFGGGHGHAATTLLLTALALLALAAYVAAAWRQRQSLPWSAWRCASFTLGIVLVLAAVGPGIGDWAQHDLRGHTVQHLLLGMFAPIPLVLGAPGTLLLRSVPVAAARALVAFLDRRAVRVLIHPVTALLLDIGGMYVLYLTPLYAWSTGEPAVHALVHLHFLVSGYLFTWTMIGPDSAPHRPGFRMRLVVLFLATGLHASLAKIMYGYGFPRGTGDPLFEIQAAAQWMYYGGDLAELVLIVLLLGAWFGRVPLQMQLRPGAL